MITVGLLYSRNDAFSLLRSEMLIGSMLMANVKFVRFLPSDINAKTLTVKGESYHHSQWVPTTVSLLDSILDFSKPMSKRTKKESLLLSKTPHNSRIDLDEFEILNILKNDVSFQNNIAEQKHLTDFTDIIDAEKKYKTIAIKNILNKDHGSVLILSKNEDGMWLIYEAYESYQITTKELKKKLENKYNNHYFIQKFIKAVAYNNRAIAFKIVTQQRFDGAWTIPIIRGAIATDGPFASISYGAEAIGAPFLEQDNSYIKSSNKSPMHLHLKLQRFTIAIAQYIKEYINGSPGALEFKVVYDVDLIPTLISVSTRAEAPNMPGRTMEFYRNLTEFSIGLSKNAKMSKIKTVKPILSKFTINNLPLLGTSIKTIVKPENFEYVLNPLPKWIDVSIGYGGRSILKNLCNIKEKDSRPSYFSLRIGNAQNDIVKDEKSLKNILAAEEYIGTGLISWKETELMRSLRMPLLKKQLGQAREVLNTKSPDIIFLEDIDLGAYGLNDEQLFEELKKTVSWFEQICKDGETKYWGVTFYNFRSKSSLNILNILQELSSQSDYYKYIVLSLSKVDDETIRMLNKIDMKSIVLSKNLSDAEIDILNNNDIHVLKDWNEQYLSKVAKKEEKEI